jgi:hypothetical protein
MPVILDDLAIDMEGRDPSADYVAPLETSPVDVDVSDVAVDVDVDVNEDLDVDVDVDVDVDAEASAPVELTDEDYDAMYEAALRNGEISPNY